MDSTSFQATGRSERRRRVLKLVISGLGRSWWVLGWLVKVDVIRRVAIIDNEPLGRFEWMAYEGICMALAEWRWAV